MQPEVGEGEEVIKNLILLMGSPFFLPQVVAQSGQLWPGVSQPCGKGDQGLFGGTSLP